MLSLIYILCCMHYVCLFVKRTLLHLKTFVGRFLAWGLHDWLQIWTSRCFHGLKCDCCSDLNYSIEEDEIQRRRETGGVRVCASLWQTRACECVWMQKARATGATPTCAFLHLRPDAIRPLFALPGTHNTCFLHASAMNFSTNESDPFGRNEDVAKLEITVLSVTFAVAVAGNLSVLAAICKTKKKPSRMHLFIKHLSLADLVVAFFQVYRSCAGRSHSASTVQTFCAGSWSTSRWWVCLHPLTWWWWWRWTATSLYATHWRPCRCPHAGPTSWSPARGWAALRSAPHSILSSPSARSVMAQTSMTVGATSSSRGASAPTSPGSLWASFSCPSLCWSYVTASYATASGGTSGARPETGHANPS